MKQRKNNLDEMQEMKLLHIEHIGCWLGFWGMFAAIYIQVAVGNGDLRSIGGESVVLCITAIYLLASCIRNGIWDRKLKPNLKTNGMISIGTGLAVGGFWFLRSYYSYHSLAGSLATFVIMALLMGVLVLLTLNLTLALYKRRRHQLDEQADREEREE